MTLTYENGSSDQPQGNGLNGRMLGAGLMAVLALVAWFTLCAILGENTQGEERAGRGIALSGRSTDLWHALSHR